MQRAIELLFASRILLFALMAALMGKHLWRHRTWLVASGGSEFPATYLGFIVFFAIGAVEHLAFLTWGVGWAWLSVGFVVNALVCYAAIRLERSQEQNASRARTPDALHELRRAVDAIERLVRHRIARDERRAR